MSGRRRGSVVVVVVLNIAVRVLPTALRWRARRRRAVAAGERAVRTVAGGDEQVIIEGFDRETLGVRWAAAEGHPVLPWPEQR